MPSHRIERTTEDIRRELTAIFRELKDPRVSGAFLSIVRVGFIRRELGHRLRLRHVPELIFNATDSIEYSANISRILSSLDIPADEEEQEDV